MLLIQSVIWCGKSVGRAIRGHFLVYDALDSLLLKNCSESTESEEVINENNNNSPANK